MKRTFVIAASLSAACCIVVGLMTAGLGARAQAQQPGGVGGMQAPAPVPASTKVGVINVGIVYTQYDRVKAWKKDMESEAEPYKKKQAELQKLITDWKQALQNPKALTQEQRDAGPRVIVECERKLQDLDFEFKKVFSKKLEDQMVVLNGEIQARIREYAGSHGYHLILAFGEPEVPLQGLMAFKRTMNVIDQGGVTVAYFAPGMDISREVVQSLNSSYRPGATQGMVPTNRTGP